MEPRGIMGGLYRASEWIMRLSCINLLWILCGSPFFIFLAMSLLSMLNGGVPDDQLLSFVQQTSIFLAILAPFTFFPATAAMFAVARKWVTGDGDVPLFKTFFRGYKENFKQSMLTGIIYSILIVVLVIDYYFFFSSDGGKIVSSIFIGLVVLVVISLLNFFSMLVHYHMKTLQLIKNAILITIGKPFRSLSTAILCGTVLYISFTQFTWLLIFFTGSIIATIAYWNFNTIYNKLQQQLDDMKKSEEEEPEITAELDREDLVKTDYKDSK
ncbi:MAG TPA: DUF624 domain-containing protein [Candidatus Paenibacillus intestinavium]|nr:DUF624 domain-containing protein [Candidatus Paenibacillus intestinavium]